LYPATKIALTELYAAELPASIVKRRKSGTQLPLGHYLENLPAARMEFAQLRETGLFHDEVLDFAGSPEARASQPLFVYAFVTLDAWLNSGKDSDHAIRLPAQARDYHKHVAGLLV
jgi:hypothetical protein